MPENENKLEHSINDVADIIEGQINNRGIPVSADEFERGVDIILEAQQKFLRSMVNNSSESVKIDSFGAAR